MLILFITVSYIISSYLRLVKDSPLLFENECFLAWKSQCSGLGLSFCYVNEKLRKSYHSTYNQILDLFFGVR